MVSCTSGDKLNKIFYILTRVGLYYIIIIFMRADRDEILGVRVSAPHLPLSTSSYLLSSCNNDLLLLPDQTFWKGSLINFRALLGRTLV